MPSTRRPQLRPLSISPCPGDEDGAVALTDPLGVSPEASRGAVRLGRLEWAIARQFDGERGADELASTCSRDLGIEVEPRHVNELERRLSELLLLADERFERALAVEFDAFRKLDRRVAIGPGAEYEADPFELRIRIGGLVADDWDMPQLPHACGLLAPAGPLGQAHSLYSRAFAAVRHTRGEIQRILLLANLGAALDKPLVPLAKPFETPLGLVQPDREALAALGLLPGRAQLAHRDARAIERQLLFCRLLFPDVPVLPILVSAIAPETSSAAELAMLDRDLERLRRLDALEGRTLAIAAADLYRTGSQASISAPPPDRGFLLGGADGSHIRDTDRDLLDHIIRLDAEGFLAEALLDEDPVRGRCAAATYALLRFLENKRSLRDDSELAGSTLGYLQMPAQSELATAAAVVFH